MYRHALGMRCVLERLSPEAVMSRAGHAYPHETGMASAMPIYSRYRAQTDDILSDGLRHFLDRGVEPLLQTAG